MTQPPRTNHTSPRRLGNANRHTRRLVIHLGLALICFGAILLLLSEFIARSAPPFFTPLLLALSFAGFVAYVLLLVRSVTTHRRRMARLRTLNYRSCPECAYDLRKADPAGTCPECGIPFTPESLQSRWEADPKVDPPPL